MAAGDHRVHPVHRALVVGERKRHAEDVGLRQSGRGVSATARSLGWASMSTDTLVRARGTLPGREAPHCNGAVCGKSRVETARYHRCPARS